MGKCIICGCETDDYRCYVRTDEDGSEHHDYQCEECTMKKVNKEREEYEIEFNEKVLPYLLENNFKVVVTGGFDENGAEEFAIKSSDVMYCVDIIRRRMKEKGYYENWIDVHWEEYNGISFEVVDYLCYALSDEDDDSWVSYSLNIVGDNEPKLKRRYC